MFKIDHYNYVINYYNYLINELNNNRKINLLVIAHNAYCSMHQVASNEYSNYMVDTLPLGLVSYTPSRVKYYNQYDLLLYYSSTFYEDEELDEIKEFAEKLSINNHKRVVVGYYYIIPKEERVEKDIDFSVDIISYDKGKIEKDLHFDVQELSTLAFTGFVLNKHDEINIECEHSKNTNFVSEECASKEEQPKQLVKKLKKDGKGQQ